MSLFQEILVKIPFIRYAALYKKNCSNRPGHFYSPVVSLDELSQHQDRIWNRVKKLHGVELNDIKQKEHLDRLLNSAHRLDLPEQKIPGKRYYFKNNSYPLPDAQALCMFLNHYQPKKIIEVGCGYSSACMLDYNEQNNLNIEFVFIEPNPEFTFNHILTSTDQHPPKNTILKNILQEIDLDTFRNLQENDILFIDNSHVSKTGSDVNWLFTEVLPILNPGVIVHIHDIFYPFEYPEAWLFKHKLNWNELFMLHAFLMFNKNFEILFFCDYLQKKYSATIQNKLPSFMNSQAGSFWMRKLG